MEFAPPPQDGPDGGTPQPSSPPVVAPEGPGVVDRGPVHGRILALRLGILPALRERDEPLGYLQFVQTVNTPEEAGEGRHRTRLFAWQPHRIDWWSASVQSIGTLLFNRTTFNAMDAALSTSQQERLVWAPDMFGSIAFMIASTLAWLEVCHGWWRWDPHDTSWRIVATGELVNVPIANLGTFVGAVCFFFGALLLIPELSDR